MEIKQIKTDTSNSEKLVWVDGTCRVDNCPTRPGKTKVAQCSVCRGCQSWYDRGHDPAKIYKGLKRVEIDSFTEIFGNHNKTKIKKTAT